MVFWEHCFQYTQLCHELLWEKIAHRHDMSQNHHINRLYILITHKNQPKYDMVSSIYCDSLRAAKCYWCNAGRVKMSFRALNAAWICLGNEFRMFFSLNRQLWWFTMFYFFRSYFYFAFCLTKNIFQNLANGNFWDFLKNLKNLKFPRFRFPLKILLKNEISKIREFSEF